MLHFGWVGPSADPPPQWDLRQAGWSLCRGHAGGRAECQHVLIVDAGALQPSERQGLADADRPAWRLLLLGVEEPQERARLLIRGCAEALPRHTQLAELDARARRVEDMFGRLPRWRNIGPLVLDLFHRDARVAGRWLALHPREFGLLWRLADRPGERVTRRQLLSDVWRMAHDPQTNSVEVHVSRLRSKLAAVGCGALVATDPAGGYRLNQDAPFMLAPLQACSEGRLDAYLRELEFSSIVPDSLER